MSTERDLIDAAKCDPRAFGPLYEAYVDLVWRYVLRRLGDPEQAADVTSTIFVRALTALPNFQLSGCDEQETSFRPWLMTIARNAVISEWRRHQPSSPLDEHILGDAAQEAHILDRDEEERVQDALSMLPRVQRQIVEMRLGGWKSAEIAAALGMSVSAVNTTHFRAYARLRDLLGAPSNAGERRRS